MKQLFFALVNLINFFRPQNWSIVRVQTYVLDTKVKVIEYMYNGQLYKYIGETLPKTIQRGFFLPIKEAFWNGRNVTSHVKPFSGPRNDFYGQVPNLSFIFHKVIRNKWIPKVTIRTQDGIGIFLHFEKEIIIEPEPGNLEVTNVLGQTSVFGAKKNLISPKLATE